MNELRKKRKQLDITQSQASKVCGVSLRTYQTYEEKNNLNDTYNDLLTKLNEMGILDGSNYIVSFRLIRDYCRDLFQKDYPEILSAFLYGDYANGCANGKSIIQLFILVNNVLHEPIEILENKLGKHFHKKVKIQTYEQLMNNLNIIKTIFIKGIKIYSNKNVLRVHEKDV